MSFKDNLLNSAKEISKYLAVKTVYDKVFSRVNRPNYLITPGLINIDRCSFNRIELEFYSNGNKLVGYYYPNNSNKLVVVCHGLRSGADDYLPFINYFIKNGFDCFSFNYAGTYESEGKNTYGMSESLVDLDNAIRFINNNLNLNKKELYLFGHSWGGFAVCSVLNIHKNIKAVASVSGFNDASTIIIDKGVFYGGKLAELPKKYIDKYQEELFGNYLKYTASSGINSSNAKILLAHGIFDLVIDFNYQSIISHQKEFINPNVKYYIGDNSNKGHDSILYDAQAINYQKEVKKQMKKYDDESEELKEYVSSIDNYKYSMVNEDLFKKIIDLFN